MHLKSSCVVSAVYRSVSFVTGLEHILKVALFLPVFFFFFLSVRWATLCLRVSPGLKWKGKRCLLKILFSFTKRTVRWGRMMFWHCSVFTWSVWFKKQVPVCVGWLPVHFHVQTSVFHFDYCTHSLTRPEDFKLWWVNFMQRTAWLMLGFLPRRCSQHCAVVLGTWFLMLSFH